MMRTFAAAMQSQAAGICLSEAGVLGTSPVVSSVWISLLNLTILWNYRSCLPCRDRRFSWGSKCWNSEIWLWQKGAGTSRCSSLLFMGQSSFRPLRVSTLTTILQLNTKHIFLWMFNANQNVKKNVIFGRLPWPHALIDENYFPSQSVR